MNIWPLRFRETASGSLLFSDDAGGFFRGSKDFLHRYVNGETTRDDDAFLLASGHAYDAENDLGYMSFAYRWAARQAVGRRLTYVVLVPTLRCNLTCGYCQVSRAPETAKGFDWTEQTYSNVLAFLSRLDTDELKIEFQGGEPLLRLDLLSGVRDFCRKRFRTSEFVVCTNLQDVGAAEWDFLDADDTYVSTSFDGDAATHKRQRTHSPGLTAAFLANLDDAVRRLGPGKVSALPTIDIYRPPDREALIDNFERLGIRSIYLRPVNRQGFARRMKSSEDSALGLWNQFHGDFIERLIARNFETGSVLEEFYFTQCLKRVLRLGVDGHVDLRNPNLFASDYIVVDHDGQLYPTDEARMQSRIGRIDLAIGHIAEGIDQEKIAVLNGATFNNFDPDCIHCAFQPYCGTDVIDDVSRYGRVDLPRHDTWFCRRHLAIFDKVFELLYRDDPATRFSVSRWAGVSDWPDSIVQVHS